MRDFINRYLSQKIDDNVDVVTWTQAIRHSSPTSTVSF